MDKEKWYKNPWVFHASRERTETLEKFYEYVINDEIKIVTCFINKRKLEWRITKDQHLLYNNITCNLIKECAENWILKWPNVIYYAARKETNKYLNTQFISQIKDFSKKFFDIDVHLRYPKQEKWLQVVDWVAYAFHNKYQLNNLNWYNKIKDMIKLESEYSWYEKFS